MKTNPQELFSCLGICTEKELLDFISSWQDFRAEEIIALRNFLIDLIKPLELNFDVYDCCGTGADGLNTFNISTATAFLASSSGQKICKNGGRSSTSTVGSVDVLEALGLNLAISLEKKIEILKQENLAFISSPVSADLLAPIKQAARKNKLASILSLIGPLTNPIKPKAQLIGVAKNEWLELMIEVCQQLNLKVILVQGDFQGQKLDEAISFGTNKLVLIENGKERSFVYTQDDDLKSSLSLLEGGKNALENAQIIKNILQNQENQAKIETLALNYALVKSLEMDFDLVSQKSIRDLSHEGLALISSRKAFVDLESFLASYI